MPYEEWKTKYQREATATQKNNPAAAHEDR